MGHILTRVQFEPLQPAGELIALAGFGRAAPSRGRGDLLTRVSLLARGRATAARGTGVLSSAAPEPDVFNVGMDSYASTTALLNDSATWNTVEDQNTSRIALVTLSDIQAEYAALVSGGFLAGGTTPPAMPPGITKAMRYDLNIGSSGANSVTVTRALLAAQAIQEIYVEWWMLWTPNFRTTFDASPPNDHKLFFGDTLAPENGRWGIYVGSDTGPDHTLMVETPSRSGGPRGNGQIGAYYPNQSGNPTPLQLWQSNTWKRMRFHFRNSTTASSLDARLRWWIDAKLIHDETGFNTHSSGTTGTDLVQGVSWCHNKDNGPPNEPMNLYTASVQAWSFNPGW